MKLVGLLYVIPESWTCDVAEHDFDSSCLWELSSLDHRDQTAAKDSPVPSQIHNYCMGQSITNAIAASPKKLLSISCTSTKMEWEERRDSSFVLLLQHSSFLENTNKNKTWS